VEIPINALAVLWKHVPTAKFSTQDASTAVADLLPPQVCAAPFAIHLCSLIDENTGDFDVANIAHNDRLFTSVHRYQNACPDPTNPDCSLIPVPSFLYEPYNWF